MIEYESLREFIELCDQVGEVQTVRGASWDLELACINELVAERGGPLLIFDDIPDAPAGFCVVTNVVSSLSRTKLALGLPPDLTALEVVDRWRQKIRAVTPLPPTFVEDAPIKANVHTGQEVDVPRLPSPRWHPADGGRYLGTGALVIMRDPEDGWINVAINRAMVADDRELAMQCGRAGQNFAIAKKYRERGEPCPVVVAVSPDPLLMIAGGFKVPWGVSELDWAGGIAGRPVKVTRGVVTDLPIPAHAEIALEGFIHPGASCDEGPFGEWTGYIAGDYKKEGGFPLLVNVESILHADSPLLLGVRPMKPPARWYTAVSIANAPGIWNQLEDGGQRGIRGVWSHVLESFGAIWTVVAIDQLYEGHAKEIGLATAVCPSANGWGAFVIVVDSDVDITNLEEVLWTLAMRCRLDRDVQRIDGIRSSSLFPWVTQEERSAGLVTGSRLIFDACREYSRRDNYPIVGAFDDAYRGRIARKFGL